MKTTLLTLLFFFLLSNSFGQCTENASSFGNNTSVPSYNISGDVSITLNNNNTISIDFASNFSTAVGPDVRLYLIKSEGKSISELKSINPNNVDSISFGLIGFSGAQSYTQAIPDNIDISEYDTVYFYCLRFNQFWDVGNFNPFTSDNCSVLNINTFKVNQIAVYPNPARDKIQISNINTISAEIRIFNVLGKQIFHQSINTEKTIDVSSFNSGIYLVKFNADGKSKTQKLVIQ